MSIRLVSVKWQQAYIYTDEIVVFSKATKQLPKNMRKVSHLSHNADVMIELKKCVFFSTRFDYMEHVIAPGKLRVAQKIQQRSSGKSSQLHCTSCFPYRGCVLFTVCSSQKFAWLAFTQNKKTVKKGTLQFKLDAGELKAVDLLEKADHFVGTRRTSIERHVKNWHRRLGNPSGLCSVTKARREGPEACWLLVALFVLTQRQDMIPIKRRVW